MVKTATASRCEATAEACGGDLPRSPWTQNAPYRVSLPAELTSFVGRRTELSSVKRLLRAHRLVTLVGIGGVGKSRLAIRAAQTVCDNYRDGVRFVELGDVTDPSDLAVALTVAARSSSTEPRPPVPGDDVADAGPANRRMLIVLDNCEHLVGACARLVTSLLRAHPDLSVL